MLSKFQKHSIPSVNFFATKLIKHEPMSDEDTLICFIMVAMSSFLCPNSSLIPCYKYFGIFEDVTSVKELDWCGYILKWLLEAVKNFNNGKSSRGYQGGTLGGCLYYLAVSLIYFIFFLLVIISFVSICSLPLRYLKMQFVGLLFTIIFL